MSTSLLRFPEHIFSSVLARVEDPLEKQRVIIAINMALAQISIYLGLFIYATVKGYNSETTYYTLISACMIAFLLVLTYFGYYKFGMIFGHVLTSVTIIFIVQRVGADSGTDHYYVLLGFMPFVFFGYRDRYIATALTGFSFVCFLISRTVQLSFIEPMRLSIEQSNVFLIVNSVFTFILCLYALLKLLQLSHAAEKILIEKQLVTEAQNEELTRVNSELDKFVYSASHDLSAPLKSMGGLIQLAKMENPPAGINQYLGLMQKSVAKLETFIQDIINYSRNSRLPIKHEQIDVQVLVKSIWEDHIFYSKQHSRIELQLELNLSNEIFSDETRLRIIFNNLLSNAIKFHVEEKREKPYVKVVVKGEEKDLLLEVSDNGSGISAAIKEDIFKMFFRGSSSVPGSGLGLYILKESVEKLKGKVAVRSEEGIGTTFSILIPIH